MSDPPLPVGITLAFIDIHHLWLRVIMPQLPLCRRLLNELDDIDCSFKHAQLSKYLQDVAIEPFHPASDDNSDSSESLISSISSISSMLSLNSDDKASLQPSLSYSFSDVEERHFVIMQAKIDRLRQEIITARVLHRSEEHTSELQSP